MRRLAHECLYCGAEYFSRLKADEDLFLGFCMPLHKLLWRRAQKVGS